MKRVRKLTVRQQRKARQKAEAERSAKRHAHYKALLGGLHVLQCEVEERFRGHPMCTGEVAKVEAVRRIIYQFRGEDAINHA